MYFLPKKKSKEHRECILIKSEDNKKIFSANWAQVADAGEGENVLTWRKYTWLSQNVSIRLKSTKENDIVENKRKKVEFLVGLLGRLQL